MSRISTGRVGALLSRRGKQLQRRSRQRNYRNRFLHRPGMEGLEPRLLLASDLLVADVVSDSVLRFDGTTGAPLGPFVTSGSGGLVDPLDPEFGPDGNLYVISNDPGHVKVLRYNGSSGASLGTFVDLDASSASAIEFGPDGNLYVATISETGVLRFNGATGEPMGVAASGNGIRRASGISFGPDGKLYVLDSDSVINISADRVLRFDPSNGAFMDQFVAPGQLNDAVFLTFGPDNQLYVPDIQQFHDVRRFSGATGTFLGVFANSPDPTNYPIFDIQFGPDGNAYAATGDGILRFDGETGHPLDTFVAGTGGSITFFPPEGPRIDLDVTDVQAPLGVVQGGEVTITYTVANNLSQSTGDEWVDVIYVSQDDLFDPRDIELGRIRRDSGIGANSSYTESLTTTLPLVDAGQYQVIVVTDRRGTTNDPERGNNIFVSDQTLSVVPPLGLSHNAIASVAVGRTLSTYTTSGLGSNEDVLIRYTVYNRTSSEIDGTLLVAALAPDVTLVSASIPPNQRGGELSWSLGKIDAFGSATVETIVRRGVSNPLQLDEGPRAFAMIDGVAVSDGLPAATLRTDPIGPEFLAATVDADSTDPFVLAKAAELDQDPAKIFDYLSQGVAFESYVGSLRGARGTLWSGAGNALDEASLGIALLRASGVPARYAQGDLPDAIGAALILSMFPNPLRITGFVPVGATVADPANDANLRQETKNHFWIQFDDGTGFQDADTAFQQSQIGQTLTTALATFNEVPDELRHKVTVRLNVEKFSQATAAFGFSDGLGSQTVIDEVFPTVQLVGRPLTVGNYVSSNSISAPVISAVTHTYLPYIRLGDEAFDIQGDNQIRDRTFQEVFTNFPFGSEIITGVFLELEVHSPNEPTEFMTRTLFDRIGFAARNGSTGTRVTVDPNGAPSINNFDLYTIGIRTGGRDSEAVFGAGLAGDSFSEFEDFASKYLTTNLSNQTALDAEGLNRTRDLLVTIQRVKLAQFEAAATALTNSLERVSLVRTYLNRPRISIASSTVDFDANLSSSRLNFAFDLRSTAQRVLPAPGQNASIASTFNLQRGFLENEIEAGLFDSDLNSNLVNKTVSVRSIFDAAEAQNIPLVSLLPKRTREVDALPLSAEAKSRISIAVTNGRLVIVPGEMIELNGQQVIGWYEVDPLTGETIGVLEDGTHGINEQVANFAIALGKSNNPAIRVFGGFLAGFLGSQVEVQLIKITINSARAALPQSAAADAATNIKNAVATLRTARQELISGQFANLLGDKFFQAGFAAGLLAGYYLAFDPPLTGALYDPVPFSPQSRRGTVMSTTNASHANGTVIGSLDTESLEIEGAVAASWTSVATTSMLADMITIESGEILAHGISLGQGRISLVSQDPASVSVNGNVTFNVVGAGTIAMFPPAAIGLGIGARWDQYEAALSGLAELSLSTANLALDGTVLPPDSYTIRTTSAQLSGTGPSTTPDFVGAVTFHVTGGTLAVGPSDQDVEVGGLPLESDQGIGMTNFEGDLSIAENGSTDTVQFNGTSANVLRVFSTPSALTVDQNSSVQFDVGIESSLTSPYVLQVEAPEGWDSRIDDTGRVTLTPAAGINSGSFFVRVSAQSLNDPNLFAHAVVPVTVNATPRNLTLNVVPDDLLFLPINGAQVRSAFRATIRNIGPTVDSFDLSTLNPPQGFEIVTSQRSVIVPAGATAIVGVYLQPSGVLPSPGSTTFFDVTVVSREDGNLSRTVSVPFVVPEIHGLTLLSDPFDLSTTPGVAVDVALVLESMGNVDEQVSFELSLSSGLTVAGLTDTSIARGQLQVQSLVLTPDATTPLNSKLFATITANFGTESPVTLRIPIRVVAPGATGAADAAVFARDFLDNQDLADRLDDLSISITKLVQDLSSDVFRKQTIASLDSIVTLLAQVEILDRFVKLLTIARDRLDSANTPAEIQAAVTSLGTVLDNFAATVFDLSEHNLELFLTPNSQVAQPLSSTQFELRIHNISASSATTTYIVSLSDLPAGVTATLSENAVTLARDEFASVTVTITEGSMSELLAFEFRVTAAAEGFPDISKSASGSLTARREFVSVVSVTAAPPFTDAGGTIDVSARLLNAVNREQKARASFVVRDSTGTQVGAASSPVDVTLTVQTSLVTLPLGSINTTGLANGSYSIVMTLLDLDGKAIPGGTGSTTFLVGSPLTASIEAAPSLLPPGTNTVSNTLKIEALAPLVSPPSLVGQAAVAGASDVVRNGDFVYVASPTGINVFDIAGANLQNPQLLRTVGSATTLLEKRGGLLVSVLSRPGGGSTTLTTFSLTDPANPTQLGTTGDIPYGSAADLIITDTHAFIVLVNFIFALNHDIIDQNGGLIAINISDPAAPFFDGDAVSAKGTPAGRDGVDDGVLFNDNGTNNDGIKNPLGIDQSGGNQNTWSIVQVSPTILLLSGSTATGTDTQNGVGVVRVVDISDPRNMRLLRDLQISGTVHVLDVAVSGNRALLTASQGGLADLTTGFPFTGNVVLATLNISDPANPQIIHQQTLDRAARGIDHVTALDNGLYAISNLGSPTDHPGLFIVDASDPNNLGIGGVDAPAGINELIGGGGSIFTTDGASLIVYAVPSKNPLTLVGQVPISGGLRGVATRNNIAYASGTNGIQIIDYADPENPTIVGTIPGNHFGARIQDNVLLALRPEGRSFYLDVYALQDTPLAPPLIGSSPLIRYDLAADLTSNSTHAFVGTFNVCFFLGSQDIYRQLGDQLAIKLNLDSIDNPTSAAPTLDSVLYNTHGDNSPSPGDVSGCAESGGDHLVYGVALATPNTTYLATTTATQGNTQAGVGRIQVVDITDAANPNVLKDLDIPSTVLSLSVGISGDVGVVIGSTQGFQDNPNGVIIGNLTVTTLDVTDRLNPKIVTTRTLDRPTSTFWVNFTPLGGGRFAFASQGIVGSTLNPSILVIDASNPRSPLIGNFSIPIDLVAPNSLGSDGKFLFTADSGGVSIYTVNPLPGLPVTARVQIPNGTGVAPIPGSFNIAPAEVISGGDFDTYVFDLTLAPSLPSETLTWQSTVDGLQPGESRPVTLGTTIDFAFQGTAGQVALPRTVVAAEQVLSLDPASQSVRPGDAAEFNVTFTNPAPVDVAYNLSVVGVPSGWAGIDSTVTVPAGGTVTKILRLATGAFDVVGEYGFLVNAVVDSVTASVAGTLVLVGAPILPDAKPDSQGVVVSLTPTSATAGQGTAATYVARLTNVGSQTDEFVLSIAGLPSGFQTTFALDSIDVPPGASNFHDVLLTIIPPQGTAADDYDFTVTATSASDASIADVATSTLRVLDIGVAVELTPESGTPESTYQMLVTNIGEVRETFDLSLAAPAALKATLGETSVTLDPGQSVSIPIEVGAIDFAFPGALSLVGVATSRSNPLVRAADGVGVDIAGLIAMTAAFDNATHVLPLPGTSAFLLLVDNIGNIEDQYSATIKSTNGPITANLVGLQGERTQSVPLFILPGLSRGAILLNAEIISAGKGTITVTVKSLTDASVSTEITAQLQAGEQADQEADLSLAMTVDNASAKVGQNVTFTIALNNAGPDGATGVSVLDKLPTGLQFVNATTSTGSYSDATGLWSVGNLAKGATTTLTIVAKLLTDQSVSNVAQVATSDQRDPDSTPGNDVVGEDDQFSAEVGTCLTGGPLVAGTNRLVFSCVTPGGFAAFVVGSQPGSYHYSKWGTTVDIADPSVPAIGVGNINGVAVVLVNLTEAQLARPLYVQAFEMLPAHKVSNLIVAQNTPEKTGTPLVADTIGLGTSPETLAALQAGAPALKAAALTRWQAAGASALLLEHLAAIDILFSDLPNDQLAATQGNFIVLDANAAGLGWFVDTTPSNDVEFTRDASGALLANTDAARDHIDALTVILHEMGHVLGEPDEPTGSVNRLMSESLSPGMRRLPIAVTSPSFGALDVNRDGYVSPMDVLLIINELNLSTGGLARTTVAGNVLDVTGDGLLTPIDALQVINYLNRVSTLNRSLAGGEGESSAEAYDSDRGSYSAVESSLVDDTLLEALAVDALNAWLAKRNNRLESS